MLQRFTPFCLLLFLAPLAVAEPPSDARRFWPAWRGPEANGVAPHGNPPSEWGESKNIRWKVAIPGKGHATPIIWDNLVIVQTAVKVDRPAGENRDEAAAEDSRDRRRRDESPSMQPDRPRRGGRRGGFGGRGAAPTEPYEFHVLALDRKTGKQVWRTKVKEETPHEAGHQDATQASCSPITDGKHIYAYFGSRGLYCLDMNGKVKWEKDFGDMQTRNGFGEGSSPALHGDTLVVNWDHEGQSFIVAMDKKSGKQLWKQDRDEPTSWSTPLIVESGGKPVVIVSATNYVRAYDLKTGELLWKCSGMTGNTIPSPVVGNGLIYLLSGFRGAALLAVRYDGAKGDLNGTDRIAFSYDRDTPYVPSPLLYDDTLYFFKENRGILTCIDAKAGKVHYGPQRLDGVSMVYASPVGASGRVYIAGRDGTTLVLKRGPRFDVLATNTLDDGFDASPAIVGDELFLRGRSHLYCIAR